MKFFRKFRGSVVANVLQILALTIGVVVVFHFLGLWWALVAFAVAIVIVSLAVDGGAK